jgi:hypothetical protein
VGCGDDGPSVTDHDLLAGNGVLGVDTWFLLLPGSAARGHTDSSNPLVELRKWACRTGSRVCLHADLTSSHVRGYRTDHGAALSHHQCSNVEVVFRAGGASSAGPVSGELASRMKNGELLADKQTSLKRPLAWANGWRVPEAALGVALAGAASRLRMHVHIMPGSVHNRGRIRPKACYYTFGGLSRNLIFGEAMTCGFASAINDVWPRAAEPGLLTCDFFLISKLRVCTL